MLHNLQITKFCELLWDLKATNSTWCNTSQQNTKEIRYTFCRDVFRNVRTELNFYSQTAFVWWRRHFQSSRVMSTFTALGCKGATIDLQSLEVQTRNPCSISYVQYLNKREFRPLISSESTVTGVVLPDMLEKFIMSIRFWKKGVLMTRYSSKTERLCILTLQSEPTLGTFCGSWRYYRYTSVNDGYMFWEMRR
jgi:hypothetical protein